MDYSEDLFAYRNYFEEYSNIKSHLIVGEESEKPVFVSIIIPTYKRSVLLKDALQSAINQKGFEDYEIVVVDNDPERSFKTETQLLIETLYHPKIRYYKHDENIGMFANWNRGIELANGEWITLLHDDDIYFSHYLARMASIIKGNSKIEGLKAKQLSWQDDGELNIFNLEDEWDKKKDRIIAKKVYKIDLFFGNLIGPTGLFYKKSNIIKLGGFNSEFYPTADYLWSSKYSLSYNIYIIKECLGVYRWLANDSLNFSTQSIMVTQDFEHIEQFRKLIGLENSFWQKMNLYLTQVKIRVRLLPYNQPLDSNLKNLLDNRIKSRKLFQILYRIYRVILSIRLGQFSEKLTNNLATKYK